MTESVIVRPSYEPRGQNEILTAHLQDMPNHILEYQLSTPENVDVIQGTNFAKQKKETSFSDPHLTPRDKMKIPKSYYTSTRHSQSISLFSEM